MAKNRLHEEIRIRDGGICIYCHDAVGQDIEHVVPLSHRGPNHRGNLVLSCRSCNIKKKGLNLRYITIAFIHLARVGEDLSWADEWLRSSMSEDQTIEAARLALDEAQAEYDKLMNE
jgi:hypothetical protein